MVETQTKPNQSNKIQDLRFFYLPQILEVKVKVELAECGSISWNHTIRTICSFDFSTNMRIIGRGLRVQTG